MREIYIRKLRYEEAHEKLEREIQRAFVEGEIYIEIVHGIGEGILKRMAMEYIQAQDFLRLIPRPDMIRTNPGSTLVELLAPSAEILRKYMKS
jgi:DNA-nicking Smr family endonuclease